MNKHEDERGADATMYCRKKKRFYPETAQGYLVSYASYNTGHSSSFTRGVYTELDRIILLATGCELPFGLDFDGPAISTRVLVAK